jgi:hypothetical protein
MIDYARLHWSSEHADCRLCMLGEFDFFVRRQVCRVCVGSFHVRDLTEASLLLDSADTLP